MVPIWISRCIWIAWRGDLFQAMFRLIVRRQWGFWRRLFATVNWSLPINVAWTTFNEAHFRSIFNDTSGTPRRSIINPPKRLTRTHSFYFVPSYETPIQFSLIILHLITFRMFVSLWRKEMLFYNLLSIKDCLMRKPLYVHVLRNDKRGRLNVCFAKM